MHIGLTGWQREAAGGDHRELLALFQRADALGFDSLWLPELHFRRSGLPYPSPLLLAAAVFGCTERIRVGTGVTLLPLQHPLLLAENLSQLDWQSGGRLDVGIGRGNDEHTMRALGIDPSTTHERFVRSYDLLVQAWVQEFVDSVGGPWRFGLTSVTPPLQQPHPPIYVAGSSLETIRFAVEHRLPHLLSLEPPEQRQLKRWHEVVGPGTPLAELGRSSLARYIFIGHTDSEAHALLDRALPYILARRRWSPVDVGDADAVAKARADLIQHQAIVGSPESCIRAIAQLARTIGAGHVRLVFNAQGGLDHATTLSQMELFAREALPACRAIQPDLEALPA
ncbi:MAG: LLM class flavin-dependent oxidoreductase [Chloroflexota bacterium]